MPGHKVSFDLTRGGGTQSSPWTSRRACRREASDPVRPVDHESRLPSLPKRIRSAENATRETWSNSRTRGIVHRSVPAFRMPALRRLGVSDPYTVSSPAKANDKLTHSIADHQDDLDRPARRHSETGHPRCEPSRSEQADEAEEDHFDMPGSPARVLLDAIDLVPRRYPYGSAVDAFGGPTSAGQETLAVEIRLVCGPPFLVVRCPPRWIRVRVAIQPRFW